MNLGGQANNSVSITLDSCVVRASPQDGIWILYPAADETGSTSPSGFVSLINTTVTDTGDFGLRIEKPSAAGVRVRIIDSTLSNVATKGHNPILIQVVVV